MDLKKFIIYTFIGTLPFAFTLGYLGVQLGIKWPIIKEYIHTFDTLIVAVVLAGIVGYIIYKQINK
jgi:Uncharacterized membrane-associated protein